MNLLSPILHEEKETQKTISTTFISHFIMISTDSIQEPVGGPTPLALGFFIAAWLLRSTHSKCSYVFWHDIVFYIIHMEQASLRENLVFIFCCFTLLYPLLPFCVHFAYVSSFYIRWSRARHTDVRRPPNTGYFGVFDKPRGRRLYWRRCRGTICLFIYFCEIYPYLMYM